MEKNKYGIGAGNPLKVCIVGGGNAAQAMAALFPHRGISCSMFVPYGNEADRIQAGVASQGYIAANFAAHNQPAGEVRGLPEKISKHAAEVIPDCNVLIMPLPSFAYREIFAEIRPYLRKGTFIGASPGQGGFDWVAREVLGPVADDVVLFSVLPMPFNCRIEDFGKLVKVQEFKRNYRVGTTPASAAPQALAITELLFGHAESCGHFLSASLYPLNAVIHPARLYSLCRKWSPGQVLPENPLFYEDLDAESAQLMAAISEEMIAVASALRQQGIIDLEVSHIRDFLARYVYQDASPDLLSFFRTNPAYKGFRCPFVKHHDGWVPDFTNRYFTEDIPLGLCLYRGVAEIAGVETPCIDKVLLWAQQYMGKQYLVNGKMAGKDLAETSCPQRFGLTTVAQLMLSRN